MAQQFNTIPHTLKNGIDTVKRADGAVWLDASKGFNEEPGWFHEGGIRAGDATDLNWHDLKNGMKTVRRPDGHVWLDESKGFNEEPGWYNSKGEKFDDNSPEARDEAIIRKFGYDPVLIKSASGYKPGMLSDVESKPFMTERGSVAGRFLKGVEDTGRGVTQLLTRAARVGKPVTPEMAIDELVAKIEEENYKKTAPDTDIARFAGSAVSSAPITPGGGILPVAKSAVATVPVAKAAVAKALGKTALAGAAGSSMQPVSTTPIEGGVRDDFVGQKLTQAGVGFLAGPLAQVGLEKAALPIARAAGKGVSSAIRRVVAGPKEQVEKGRKILSEMRSEKIEPKTSMVIKSSELPAKEARGAEAVVKDIGRVLDRDVRQHQFTGIEDINRAASNPNSQFHGRAKQLLEEAKNISSDEPEKLLKTSLGIRSLNEKIKFKKKFGYINELAEGVEVDPSKTASVLDNFVNTAKGQDGSKWVNNPKFINDIESLSQRLKDSPNSFKSMSNTRSELKETLRQFRKGANEEIGKRGADVVESAIKSIDDSMSSAAQKSGRPQLAAMDKMVRREYANYAGTFKDPVIVKALHTDEPLAVIEAIERAGKERAQRVFDAVDEKGKAAFAKMVFNKAIEGSREGSTGTFNVGKAASGIDKEMDLLGVTLKGDILKRVNGAKNILQHINRGKVGEGETGFGAVTSAVGGVSRTVKAGVGFIRDLGVDALFNNQAGKRLLYDASRLKPGSTALDRLIEARTPAIVAASQKRTETDKKGGK